MSEAVQERTRSKLNPLYAAIVMYAAYEFVLDVGNGALDGIFPNAEDSGDDAEWLRRQPLLDELIFGGFGDGGPDPDDDDHFRIIIERVILYGGIAAKEISKAIGYGKAGSQLSRWKEGRHLPHRAARRGILDTIRRAILRR